jgi:Putative metal-binding motif/Dictyostelium (slime mold) repeat
MFLTFPRVAAAASLLFGLFAFSCGARTGVLTVDPDAGTDAPAPPAPCVTDVDCDTGDRCAAAQCLEGTCVPLPVVTCNDQDACTDDSCDPNTGKCLFTPVTLDLDGDGHRSPKPGFAPGAPGSCGDDCDDRSAAAHPGGVEVCDGVDNDCNGKIDDGSAYGGLRAPVRVSSAAFDRANAGGLAFDGKNYGATFSGHKRLFSSYFEGISQSGAAVVPETALADINSETYAGPLLHNGSFFESAWSDARQDRNYEVYFNRYDSNGKKLGPDLRVTNAPNFSTNPALVWNGTESLLVWDDRRFNQGGPDVPALFGQRVAFDGTLTGSNLQLTDPGVAAETPSIALGEARVGLAFASQLSSTVTHAQFFTTASDLSARSALVDLGGSDVLGPSVVHFGGRFLVAWGQLRTAPGPSIFGALVDENGTVLRPAQPLTAGANFARTFALLSLGDRALLVWADDHDGNYELYQEIFDSSLNVVSPRQRLTFTMTDSLGPSIAFGPSGDLGVLYDDWLTGSRQSYFLSLSCIRPGMPAPPSP